MGDNAYKQAHREQGLCLHCSSQAYPRFKLCAEHLHGNNVACKKYYRENREQKIKQSTETKAKRRMNGQCTNCSNPLDPDADCGCVTCINCREGIGRFK